MTTTEKETTMRVPPIRDGATPTDRTPEPVRGGPWTSHGHPIAGLTIHGPGRPSVARCGGPRMCNKCATEQARLMEAARIDDDRTETITDRAAIRDSDEPSERGDFPYYDLGPATSETVAALDLDAIEGRARYALEWGDSANKEMILALVAYARRKSTLAADNHARAEAAVAEVERLRQDIDECWVPLYHDTKHERDQATARAESAEAEVRSLRAKVAAVEAKRDEFADLLARALPAVAALARVEALGDNNPDHADTCGSMLTPGAGYPCSCWQADLRAALATGEGK